MTAGSSFQDVAHGADHNYEVGSPHLTHAGLRDMILTELRAAVAERMEATGGCRVLELGAGHGAFTDHVLATGASVTVTEMSRSSADLLSQRYRHNPSAEVIFDEAGDSAALSGAEFDLVTAMAVLHHIPDYLAAISTWTGLLAAGGGFISFQDPLWYPRVGALNHRAQRGAFYAWRLTRGDLVEGTRSFLRRKRGQLDEQNERDMVEYHVLRNGVDEQAVVDMLRPSFASVSVLRYWSTPSRAAQQLGERFGAVSEFGIRAEGHG